MNENNFSPATILFTGFFALIIVFVFFFQSISSKTKIVFCDVGQGDATYIRIKNKIDVLIDTGPDKKILNCLGKYMPFFDKEIEILILSHLQKDHYGGLLHLFQRYKINRIYMAKTKIPSSLITLLKSTNALLIFAKASDTLKIFNVNLNFLWPKAKTETFCQNDNNCFSLVFLFKENNFKALFTGDTTAAVLSQLTRKNIDDLVNLNVLKIPHHGSKYGMNREFLKLADPKVAVISVGKNNTYGHPAKETLDLLYAFKTKIKRTDKEGDIVFEIQNPKFKMSN